MERQTSSSHDFKNNYLSLIHPIKLLHLPNFSIGRYTEELYGNQLK